MSSASCAGQVLCRRPHPTLHLRPALIRRRRGASRTREREKRPPADRIGNVMASLCTYRVARMTVLALALAVLAWLVPSAAPARATPAISTITVNTLADNNTHGDHLCTLREAIDNANNSSDITGGDCAAGSAPDLIRFSVGRTIVQTTLAGGELPISDFITIDG